MSSLKFVSFCYSLQRLVIFTLFVLVFVFYANYFSHVLVTFCTWQGSFLGISIWWTFITVALVPFLYFLRGGGVYKRSYSLVFNFYSAVVFVVYFSDLGVLALDWGVLA